MFPLFDISLFLNGFPIKKAKISFEKILSISDENYEEYVIQKRKEIAEYHLRNNPYYREIVGKDFFEKWEDLPVMTKKTFKNPCKKDFLKDLQLKIFM